jgi:membrane protease YdiL (CAAX protease family)
MDRFNGLPEAGVLGVWALLTVVNGFGEETGWRGFALPLLQKRFRPLPAGLIVAVLWALWHVPYFFILPTYRGLGPAHGIGFVFGLACGAIVLTWLYNRSSQSILIVTFWHGTFNLVSGTEAVRGAIATVVSTCVMIQALFLVACEIRARHRQLASPCRPRGLETPGA